MTVPLTSRASVAIVGAGSQGRRLAYMWSSQGKNVHLVDAQPNQLKSSVQAIDKFRATLAPNGTYGKIITHGTDSLTSALKDSWLVIECVPERLPLKRQLITELDALAPEDTIVASNSSSYSCGEILETLALKNAKRVLSAHVYWPPETSSIEIMGHETTDPSCIAVMMKECAAHGFTPFHVKTPSMGYIYNRIWAAIKREALLTAAEGAATPEEIDAVFRDVMKAPKGPFQLMDLVGLDVVLDIEDHYASARRNIPVEPREYLDRFIQKGNLGMKSGRGFYDYGGSSVI